MYRYLILALSLLVITSCSEEASSDEPPRVDPRPEVNPDASGNSTNDTNDQTNDTQSPARDAANSTKDGSASPGDENGGSPSEDDSDSTSSRDENWSEPEQEAPRHQQRREERIDNVSEISLDELPARLEGMQPSLEIGDLLERTEKRLGSRTQKRLRPAVARALARLTDWPNWEPDDPVFMGHPIEAAKFRGISFDAFRYFIEWSSHAWAYPPDELTQLLALSDIEPADIPKVIERVRSTHSVELMEDVLRAFLQNADVYGSMRARILAYLNGPISEGFLEYQPDGTLPPFPDEANPLPEVVLEATEHPNSIVREDALVEIERRSISSETATKVVDRLLRDDFFEVRLEAAKYFWLGSDPSAEHLRRQLSYLSSEKVDRQVEEDIFRSYFESLEETSDKWKHQPDENLSPRQQELIGLFTEEIFLNAPPDAELTFLLDLFVATRPDLPDAATAILRWLQRARLSPAEKLEYAREFKYLDSEHFVPRAELKTLAVEQIVANPDLAPKMRPIIGTFIWEDPIVESILDGMKSDSLEERLDAIYKFESNLYRGSGVSRGVFRASAPTIDQKIAYYDRKREHHKSARGWVLTSLLENGAPTGKVVSRFHDELTEDPEAFSDRDKFERLVGLYAHAPRILGTEDISADQLVETLERLLTAPHFYEWGGFGRTDAWVRSAEDIFKRLLELIGQPVLEDRQRAELLAEFLVHDGSLNARAVDTLGDSAVDRRWVRRAAKAVQDNAEQFRPGIGVLALQPTEDLDKPTDIHDLVVQGLKQVASELENFPENPTPEDVSLEDELTPPLMPEERQKCRGVNHYFDKIEQLVNRPDPCGIDDYCSEKEERKEKFEYLLQRIASSKNFGELSSQKIERLISWIPEESDKTGSDVTQLKFRFAIQNGASYSELADQFRDTVRVRWDLGDRQETEQEALETMMAYSTREASSQYIEETLLRAVPTADISTSIRRQMGATFLGHTVLEGGEERDYRCAIRAFDDLEEFSELYKYRAAQFGAKPYYYISSPDISAQTALAVAYNTITRMRFETHYDREKLVIESVALISNRDDVTREQKHTFYRAAMVSLQGGLKE